MYLDNDGIVIRRSHWCPFQWPRSATLVAPPGNRLNMNIFVAPCCFIDHVPHLGSIDTNCESNLRGPDHLADRLGLLPIDIALVGIWHQRQPHAAHRGANFCTDLRGSSSPVLKRTETAFRDRTAWLTMAFGSASDAAKLSPSQAVTSCTPGKPDKYWSAPRTQKTP
jgi:hypothetical protein